ncbi:putative alpha-L-arabinofuranosidase axhA-1 [Pestalotiopsis sp. IQ-011]
MANRIYVGTEFCRNEEFLTNAADYAQVVVITSELIRPFPDWFKKLDGKLDRFGQKPTDLVQIVDGWIKDTSNDTQQLLNNLLFPTTLAVLRDEDVIQYKAHYHETFDEDIATPVEYETENGDLIGLWIEIVEDYTSRALTVASDRPLAISGLASRVAPLLQDGYKAGHWLQYMPMDLLWYVSEAKEGSHVYQAPSWSWTSVKGPIIFNTRGRLMSSERRSLKILDVDVTAVDAMAPFGAVRSGQIRASGKVLKVSWVGEHLVAGHGVDQVPLFSAASEDAAPKLVAAMAALAPGRLSAQSGRTKGIGYM